MLEDTVGEHEKSRLAKRLSVYLENVFPWANAEGCH